jgi:hypothetical protein
VAMARPMPLAPPVTTATRSFSEKALSKDEMSDKAVSSTKFAGRRKPEQSWRFERSAL